MNLYLVTLFSISLAILLFLGMEYVRRIKLEKWQGAVLVALVISLVGAFYHSLEITSGSVFMSVVAVIRMYFD